MYEVEEYKQEFHSKDLCHRKIYFENVVEDTKLTFRAVSYDEEAEELIDHNEKWSHNLLMKNVLNYVDRPVKYKNIFKIHMYHLRYNGKFI